MAMGMFGKTYDTTEKKDKKRKKEKHDSENSSKRRKRDGHEENESPESQPHEKKHRKDKKHKKDKTATTQADSTSTARPTTNNTHEQREQLLLEKHSPFSQVTTSLYLPLSPCAYFTPLQGLCAEHLSPLLLTYYPPLHGVVLAYSNPRLSEHPTEAENISEQDEEVLAKSISEYAVSYIWLTAEFTLFRPKRGTRIEGYVSLQNVGLLGLVCYNYFNAVIERDKLPQDWSWVEGGDDGMEDHDDDGGKTNRTGQGGVADGTGHFVDGEGERIEGRIMFRVDDFEASSGGDTISILGTMRDMGQ